MKRRISISVIALAFMLLMDTAIAGLELPNAQPIFNRNGYDYAPSTMVEGNFIKIWWCGLGTIPGTSTETDVIFYRAYNISNGTYSPTLKVLWPTTNNWDSVFVCDPSVIKGEFRIPGNQTTYSYAMYYTATDQNDGRNNRIGVAFSNNGINWTKTTNPVIYPTTYPTTTYGAGNSGIYNRSGKSNLIIIYADASSPSGPKTYIRMTIDGINFDSPQAVSKLNDANVTLKPGDDFAYDWAAGEFYLVANTIPVRAGERESYQFGLFKMDASEFLTGNGVWETLAMFNTANTGFRLNHNPGIMRNKYGNVTNFLPGITIFFGAGDNSANTWNLASATWSPSPQTLPLKRYFTVTGCAGQMPEHWITTGYVRSDCNYDYKQTLGYLSMAPNGGMTALHGCINGQDHLVNKHSCGSATSLGIEGWIYTTPGPGRVAIYQCTTGSGASLNHFVSRSLTCEGRTSEGLLGYILTAP